jgi:hypothetical protein
VPASRSGGDGAAPPPRGLVVTFGSLAVVVMASALLEATGATEEAAGWVVKPVLAAVFLFPYLLFRFTAAMDRGPPHRGGRGPAGRG